MPKPEDEAITTRLRVNERDPLSDLLPVVSLDGGGAFLG